MNWSYFEHQMDCYLNAAEPFLFVIDFDALNPFICPLEKAAQHHIFYQIKGQGNAPKVQQVIPPLQATIVDKTIFTRAFQAVQQHLHNGDSYLLNLTFPAVVNNPLSLTDIFNAAKAPYKLLFDNQFVCFSPECFIKTHGDFIYTYPMKGTIDAHLPNAAEQLMNNPKEQWEHNTVIDLLRNDLAMLASDIRVTRYRYVEKIHTQKGDILQTSSEIRGRLSPDWKKHFAKQLRYILPAGSISGAPKKRTIEIIKANEITPRGYYTGIFGVFNGSDMDTAVMIRFIEKQGKQLIFKSGGGITAQSDLDSEYHELQQKIYIPTV